VNTEADNDSVLDAAQRMLESNGEAGHDDLHDSLDGAWDADLELCEGNEERIQCALGRGFLRAALEEHEETGEWSMQIYNNLLQGLLERAVQLKALVNE